MRQKGFRQNFTQSFATLPLVALVTAAVWMLPNLSSLRLGGGLLATALMTYVVIECNNRYHLLRVRSRMNSVVFLVLMAAFPTLHDLGGGTPFGLLCFVSNLRTNAHTRHALPHHPAPEPRKSRLPTADHRHTLLALCRRGATSCTQSQRFRRCVARCCAPLLDLSCGSTRPLRLRLDACSCTTLGTTPSAADFCLCRCSPLPLGGLRRSDCTRYGGHGAFFLLILL